MRTRDGAPSTASKAHPGTVVGAECERLAAGFGAVLKAERAARGWSRAELAASAGVAVLTVARLERGQRRPSTSMTWRLARALRDRSALREQVALDARLQATAGTSLRQFNTRTHARRARVAAELAAERSLPVTGADDFTALCLTYMTTGRRNE